MEKKNKFLEHLVKCVGTVAHEDRENLVPLKEEPDRVNLSIKVDVDSCHISEKQERQPAVVLGEEVSHHLIYLRAVENLFVIVQRR